jgi:hypothetical protein
MDPVTIIAAISAASKLIEQGVRIMEERRRNRELTPEQEAEWDRLKAETLNKPHWEPSFMRPK